MGKGKLFNDCVHGHFELPQLCIAIIDTPVFQRLRYLKQLGLGYYVYPSASHNRFEHSLGVCHLAGEIVDSLNMNNENDSACVSISPEEKLCLQVAGLCHDLGHGPFSHSWERFVHEASGERTFEHEKMSIDLLDFILKNYENVEKEFKNSGLVDDHKEFIKRLICGKKNVNDDRDFLFEIICNHKTGIDVDKWDYILRDGKQLNINSTFDPHRLLKCLKIAKVEGKYHICFRNKERQTILQMYLMRAELFRSAYQHPVVKMIEEMWVDAMKKADEKGYLFRGVKLSKAHENPAVYSLLTDYLFQDILLSQDERLSEAKTLLERIHTRNLYKVIHKTTLSSGDQSTEEIIKSTEEKKLDLYASILEVGIGDLPNNVFVYDKENASEAKLDHDWKSVFVFPINMTKVKRTEVFHFCKQPNTDMKLMKKIALEIVK